MSNSLRVFGEQLRQIADDLNTVAQTCEHPAIADHVSDLVAQAAVNIAKASQAGAIGCPFDTAFPPIHDAKLNEYENRLRWVGMFVFIIHVYSTTQTEKFGFKPDHPYCKKYIRYSTTSDHRLAPQDVGLEYSWRTSDPLTTWQARARVSGRLCEYLAEQLHPREAGEQPSDDVRATDYVGAMKLICDRYPTYRDVKKALVDNPQIRTKKPTPKARRLNVHRGDWFGFIEQQSEAVSPADLPAEAVDAFVEEVEKRKELVRREKQNRGEKPSDSTSRLLRKMNGK